MGGYLRRLIMHKHQDHWLFFLSILLEPRDVHTAVALQTESNVDILTEDGHLILIE